MAMTMTPAGPRIHSLHESLSIMITIDELKAKFPESHELEIERFHSAFGDHAAERLEHYHVWRERMGVVAMLNEQGQKSAWENSISTLFNHLGGKNSKEAMALKEMGQILHSKSLSGKDFVDKENHKVVFVLPALLDTKIASEDTFVSLFGLFLEHNFEREKGRQLTMLVDVRPGKGWPNTPGLKMINFIRHIAVEIHHLFPGRLQHCFLYPVPRPAVFLWKLVHTFIHQSVKDCVVLLPGSALLGSKLPHDRLMQHVEESVIDDTEKVRENLFQ